MEKYGNGYWSDNGNQVSVGRKRHTATGSIIRQPEFAVNDTLVSLERRTGEVAEWGREHPAENVKLSGTVPIAPWLGAPLPFPEAVA